MRTWQLDPTARLIPSMRRKAAGACSSGTMSGSKGRQRPSGGSPCETGVPGECPDLRVPWTGGDYIEYPTLAYTSAPL